MEVPRQAHCLCRRGTQRGLRAHPSYSLGIIGIGVYETIHLLLFIAKALCFEGLKPAELQVSLDPLEGV